LQGKDAAGTTQYFGEITGTIGTQSTWFPMVTLCDATTPTQCASVNNSGQISISNSNLMSSFGAALPSQGSAIGVNTGNVLIAPHMCGSYAVVTPTTATNTQVVAAVSGKNIYVCDIDAFTSGAADNFYLESATAASCGGTLTAIAPTRYFPANWGEKATMPYYEGINAGSGNALCVNTSAAATISIGVHYDQY
jgi:hypothetical protein